MVSRSNGQTGQRFWGCKAFPKCKGTRDTDGMSPEERKEYRERRKKEPKLFDYDKPYDPGYDPNE